MKLKSVATIFIIAWFAACSKGSSGNGDGGGNGNVDCSVVAKSFSANVLPITSSRCAIAGCHAAGSTNGPGEQF